MKGYVTDPASPGGLALVDFNEPFPQPNEVVVEVNKFTISRGELTLLEIRPEGFRPGQEVAGIVVQGAVDGTGPPVGSRIAGLVHGAGWSERVAVPASTLGVVPASLEFDASLVLAGSGLTAKRALDAATTLAGKHVLITGAAGSVGITAVQLAHSAGAEVTALVRDLKRQGALRAGPRLNISADIEEVGGQFDIVLDGVGGSILPAAIRRLAPGGTALSYGQASGQASPISPGDFRNAPGSKLMGFFLWLTDNKTFGADMTELYRKADQGDISVAAGKTCGWLQIREMLSAMRRGDIIGKAVLTIDRPVA